MRRLLFSEEFALSLDNKVTVHGTVDISSDIWRFLISKQKDPVEISYYLWQYHLFLTINHDYYLPPNSCLLFAHAIKKPNGFYYCDSKRSHMVQTWVDRNQEFDQLYVLSCGHTGVSLQSRTNIYYHTTVNRQPINVELMFSHLQGWLEQLR